MKRNDSIDKNSRLKPISDPPKTFKIGAGDIEGIGGPGGFELGSISAGELYADFISPETLLDFIRAKQFNGYRFFFHNLSYDYGILEPYIYKTDTVNLLNGRPYKVAITDGNKHPRFLADSLLFAAGLPLRKVGESVHLPKLNTPPELTGNYEGVEEWYCDTHHKLWCVECYLRRDTDIVQKYMDLFQETINVMGGEMQFTLASTAMDLFRRRYLHDTYITPFPLRNEYCRHAYYGGRVEPFKLGTYSNVSVYDINSLYPFVMKSEVYPNPNTLSGPMHEDNPNIIYEYEGVSQVTIYCPERYAPVLPLRHNGRLFFPFGLMRGNWTHVELRAAVERGAEITTVHSSVIAKETCRPFVDYVDTLYAKRLELKSIGDPAELVIKILLNSLYGKFGQRVDAGLQEIKPIEWWLNGNQHVKVQHRVVGNMATVLVGKGGDRQPQYINTMWSSYITSYARLTLLKYMEMVGDDLLYVDTDSIFTFGELPVSKELGAMKLEHYKVDVDIIGPKAYIIHTENDPVIVKCKGIPAVKRLEYLQNGTVEFTRPVGLLEAGRISHPDEGIIHYPSEWITVKKVQQVVTPKRLSVAPLLGKEGQLSTLPHEARFLPE